MKDGNLSLILNDVSTADSGTYKCRVYMKETRSWESISINLSVVDPPGQTGGHTEDGSVGLKVGLPVGLIVAAVVVVVGVFLIYRKLKPQEQGSYQPPAEQQPV
ncbi:unnamed protein product [Oreochromis niloticus]|nr:unnamed protein product [Mustela putorius furo]